MIRKRQNYYANNCRECNHSKPALLPNRHAVGRRHGGSEASRSAGVDHAGSVPCTSLGRTLMHEHVLSFVGPVLKDPDYAPIPDRLRRRR